jgi:2-dehydro-3-deoxyphosphogalactonate aldolase
MSDTTLAALLLHPLVAILRGIRPDEVLGVADVLIDCGWRSIEIPLNSPEPFTSIERLAARYGSDTVIGAGTVLNATDARRCADAGARLVLAPNRDAEVIRTARALGLVVMPGVATPSEAFEALAAGAQALKLFPADVLGTASFKGWKAVLPAGVPLFAVGGVDGGNLRAFREAGAAGAGLGSSLYVPGRAPDDLRARALALAAAWSPGTS